LDPSSDFSGTSLKPDWVSWGGQNGRLPTEGMVFTNGNLYACHVDLSGDHLGKLVRTHALLEQANSETRIAPDEP
jgi:hypothetical protein